MKNNRVSTGGVNLRILRNWICELENRQLGTVHPSTCRWWRKFPILSSLAESIQWIQVIHRRKARKTFDFNSRDSRLTVIFSQVQPGVGNEHQFSAVTYLTNSCLFSKLSHKWCLTVITGKLVWPSRRFRKAAGGGTFLNLKGRNLTSSFSCNNKTVKKPESRFQLT